MSDRPGKATQIDELLRETIAREGSDLHYIAGDPPRIRLNGELMELRAENLKKEKVAENLDAIMSDKARNQVEQFDGTDLAYRIEGLARFRVNIMRHVNGLGAVFRVIPSKALTLEELGMPEAIHTMSKQNSGLILVTGQTGSGKSTTLAAMIDAINDRIKGHIITIEDPIEFVHVRKNCLISQREVGVHAPGFAEALRSALREDPDVVLVGELRDLETISIAVTAAEMGILVMGTLHTNGAAPTVDRMVHVFPADKQSHIRTMLSTSLRGVISQQLLRRADRRGRVAALEILINTPAAANLIRQGKLDQIENVMQGGSRLGMQTMDIALQNLVADGKIKGKDAYYNALNKSLFQDFMSGEELLEQSFAGRP